MDMNMDIYIYGWYMCYMTCYICGDDDEISIGRPPSDEAPRYPLPQPNPTPTTKVVVLP